MSGKTMTRREFLRGGVCALFGAAAVSGFGKNFFPPETARAADAETAVDATSLSITRDISKCIGCGKCVEMCSGRQGLDILTNAEAWSGDAFGKRLHWLRTVRPALPLRGDYRQRRAVRCQQRAK